MRSLPGVIGLVILIAALWTAEFVRCWRGERQR